jgi:pimeloyl-ACP methyl ester carboxylesterase
VPLKDGSGRAIGVLQLINAQDKSGEVIAFDAIAQQMLESLGSLAAAALATSLREQQLRQEISDLRIEIDQQKKQQDLEQITSSPYFAGLQSRARQMREPGARLDGRASAEDAEPEGPVRKVYMVGDQEIVVREQGPARGRLLLMIHGWSSSWYALSPLLNALSDRFRCVAVDLPGFGESPPLKERASIPAYADLLAELIGQLSPGLPVILVGHSMGGMTSVTLALRHAALIERMVLLCPTISGKLSTWINTAIYPITWLERSRVAGKIVAQLEPYMLSITDRLMRPASFAARSDISEADYHRLRADARRPGQGRVRAECFWAMRENDLQGRLKGIGIPTMVIWGMEDNTVPLRDASVIADEWPGAQLQVLPKAGHWPHFESPEITRRHIRSFLSTPIKLLRAQRQS